MAEFKYVSIHYNSIIIDKSKYTPTIEAKMIKIMFQETIDFAKFLNPTDFNELNVILRKELGIDVTTFKSKIMNKIVKTGKLKTDEEYEFVKNIICDTSNYDFYSQEFLAFLNELLNEYEGGRLS